MSMFNRNNANVSSNVVKLLRMANVYSNDGYSSQLAHALRYPTYPPIGFKKANTKTGLRAAVKNTQFQKKAPPLFHIPVGCLKKPLDIYISNSFQKLPVHLLDA